MVSLLHYATLLSNLKGRDKITDQNSKLFGRLKDDPFNPYHEYKDETVLVETWKDIYNDTVNHPEKKGNQNMNTTQKETAIHSEQQQKTKQEIVNDIINILAGNNLTITDAKDILYTTSKAICRQKVRIS